MLIQLPVLLSIMVAVAVDIIIILAILVLVEPAVEEVELRRLRVQPIPVAVEPAAQEALVEPVVLVLSLLGLPCHKEVIDISVIKVVLSL